MKFLRLPNCDPVASTTPSGLPAWGPRYRSVLTSLGAGDSTLNQLSAHGLARAEQTVLDCAQRQARNLGNLVVAQIMRMPQDNQLAISCRERVHHGFNFRAPFFLFAFLLGREPQALEGNFAALVVRTGDQRLSTDGVSTQMIDGRVVGDFVYPGGKLEFGAIARQ